MDSYHDFAQKREQWKQALESSLMYSVAPILAVEYTRGWRTKSEPVLLECEDGEDYVVKGQQAGRQIVNDQLVARLGKLLDAPVGKAEIILIPQTLINNNPRNLENFRAGLSIMVIFFQTGRIGQVRISLTHLLLVWMLILIIAISRLMNYATPIKSLRPSLKDS